MNEKKALCKLIFTHFCYQKVFLMIRESYYDSYKESRVYELIIHIHGINKLNWSATIIFFHLTVGEFLALNWSATIISFIWPLNTKISFKLAIKLISYDNFFHLGELLAFAPH